MAKPEKTVSIGSVSFRPGAEALAREDGSQVALRPQTARVLDMLAATPGQVVTKEALMQSVWAETFVTDDSLVQCISEIRKALGPEDAALLKTVPKQGYRLEATAHEPPASRPRPKGGAGIAAVAGLILIALIGVYYWFDAPPADRPAPAIAVLPFENASADEARAYYASGVSDELIVKLSQISDLQVASRSASNFVAVELSDPRQIAKELAVTHLVEGSVRRAGNSLRITAALIDGQSGENLWAARYDGVEADVFAFQDQVVDEIVRVLAVRLSAQERARLGVRGTTNIDAFDHYLRGIRFADFLNATSSAEAEAAFRQAIRLDPGYAAAHAQLSLVLSMQAEFGWAERIADTVARASEHAERAVALDPALPVAHFALGRLLSRRFLGDLDGAAAAFQRAIELDPNYADAYAFMALVQIFSGDAEQGLQTANDAMGRNPVPPYWYFMPIGLAQYHLGDYAAAEAALLALLDRNPNFQPAMRALMATYGRMGRADDAQWVAMEFETLGGAATVTNLLSTMSTEYDPYRAAIAEGLRMAELPE